MSRRLKLTAALAVGGVTAAALPAFVGLVGAPSAFAATFGEANLVVYRVGDGTNPLTNAATQVSLEEYDASGNHVQSLALPSAGSGDQNAVTATGLSTSEGQLSRSPDGRFLTATGYDAPAGTVGVGGRSLTTSDPTNINRSIAIVDGRGHVDTSTALSDADAPYIVRSAVTVDGSRVWAVGGNGGVRRIAAGVTGASQPITGSENLNQIQVADGQLFASTAAADKLVRVGTGTPVSAASLAGVPGIGAVTLPNGFVLFDETGDGFAGTSLDTLYLANAAHGGGAIEKYRFSGATWGLVGSTPVEGVLGLAAQQSGSTVAIAATTPTQIVGLTDSDAAGTTFNPSVSQLASAPTNTEFRGIAIAPVPTAGPSIFVKNPLADAAAISGGSLPVAVDVVGSTVSAVSARVDNGTNVAAVHGSGNRWTAALPLAAVGNGSHVVTISATDANGTASASRTIVRTGAISGPVKNAKALGAGNYGANHPFVNKGGFRVTAFKPSPTKKGLLATTKTSANFLAFGRKLTLVFATRPDGGKVTITVDGKPKTLDLYAKRAGTSTVVFNGLALANHVVRVTATKTHQRKSKGYAVLFGRVQVS